MIRAIAAIDDRNGIAISSGLRTIPWDIPEDMARFKSLTQGAPVLMGVHTYETLPQPLPGRHNVVLSRQLDSVRPGFELARDLESFVSLNPDLDMWVIGGSELYKTALQHCQQLYITHVSGDFSCDRFFPDYTQEFALTEVTPRATSGEYTYRFAVYDRIKA